MQKQQKALRLISDLLEERRKSHSEGCNKGDFLDQIVEDMGKEAFLTKEFVTIVMFGLLLASVEIVSATITLAIKYLLDNPSAVQQLTVSILIRIIIRFIFTLQNFHVFYMENLDFWLKFYQEEHEEILKKREGTNPGLSWEEYKTMTFTHYVSYASFWQLFPRK